MNKILSITRNIIPYVKELRKINEVKSSSDAILMQQLDYWFSKSEGKPFYKFTSPPEQQNPFYKDGDSWCEELSFSVDEFRTAFGHIGIKYNSKKEFQAAIDSEMGLFQNKFYAAYTDKMKYITYYHRNNELVDYILNCLINGEYQSTEIAIDNLRKQTKPIYVNGESQSTYMGKANPELNTDSNTNTNTDNKTNSNTYTREQVAPVFAADFPKVNEPVDNENEQGNSIAADKNLSTLNTENISNEEEGGGDATRLIGKVNAHLQKRMSKLITTKVHKNEYSPIYEKAHAENGFQALNDEQQNNVFAKFLAKSFVNTQDKEGNYILPTLRQNKSFCLKLITLFETVEWQKKTWGAIGLQAKSLIQFDSSPEFCCTLIDRALKGSAQTEKPYLQLYYDFAETKLKFDAFVKTKQAAGSEQNGNKEGASFVRFGKVIVFDEVYGKPNSCERFGMYEGEEYCLTFNGAFLTVLKDDSLLANNVQEFNSTARLRKLIREKGSNI